jgi:phthalate 4,5-cis-dihydrodiol dehydrogenase
MSGELGIGIVGWGAAGQLMAAAVARTPRFRLRGIADLDPRARQRAMRDARCAVVPDVDSLAAMAGVDIVYVASPTAHHLAAIRRAANLGKHVISEKPLAAGLADALSVVDAARAAGVTLLVGATHSYDAPVRALRRIVEDGRLGSLQSLSSACHTDWHRRRRSPDDLDAEQGNGLVFRQGAHQIDIVRYVCGGQAESIFGTTFGGCDGAERGFSAQVGFAGEVHASLHYTGVGGFDSRLLTWGVGETASFDVPPTPPLTRYFVLPDKESAAPVSPMFGTTVATFAGGSAWLTPLGVLLFEDDRVAELSVAGEPSGWDAVLSEMDAVLSGSPPVHSGEWGVATLEACLALHESARTGARVSLNHQIPVAAGTRQSQGEKR